MLKVFKSSFIIRFKRRSNKNIPEDIDDLRFFPEKEFRENRRSELQTQRYSFPISSFIYSVFVSLRTLSTAVSAVHFRPFFQ